MEINCNYETHSLELEDEAEFEEFECEFEGDLDLSAEEPALEASCDGEGHSDSSEGHSLTVNHSAAKETLIATLQIYKKSTGEMSGNATSPRGRLVKKRRGSRCLNPSLRTLRKTLQKNVG